MSRLMAAEGVAGRCHTACLGFVPRQLGLHPRRDPGETMNDAVFEPLGSGPPVSGRIVHAADLHLGAPLDSLGVRIGADKAARLRDRSIGAFGRLIDATIACGADALVLAGDVYDQADREVAAQLRLRRGLERLADEGIRVFVAHGNHDPVVTAYRPASALPSNVTVFEPGGVQVRDLELRSGDVLLFGGAARLIRHEVKGVKPEVPRPKNLRMVAGRLNITLRGL